MTSAEGIGRELEIYTSRFTPEEINTREITWQVLCEKFFSRYVQPTDVVVDLGAGDGYFIRNIKAKRKIAIDLSAHVQELSKDGIEVHQVLATQLPEVCGGSHADVIFMSNFLEHLPDKRILLEVFAACFRGLKNGGCVAILQPNIRYCGASYWDYVDHHIALTEWSLKEGLEVSGFKVETLIPRFLPYTVKSGAGKIASLISPRLLVSTYLRLPFLWRFLGHQTFIVARKITAPQ